MRARSPRPAPWPPFARRRAWAWVLGWALLAAACGPPGAPPVGSEGAARDGASAAAEPERWVIDSEPFSPTLAHLFDEGRIVVLPEAAAAVPPAGSMVEGYAWSAVDRYGRLYHFDARGGWWMAPSPPLPAPLPAGQWDAAWNPASQSLELLVTAPYLDADTMQRFALHEDRWTTAPARRAPPARWDAVRLPWPVQSDGEPVGLLWLAVGGTREGEPAADGWCLVNDQWTPWGEPSGAPVGEAPDLAQTLGLVAGPPGAGVELFDRHGARWLWRDGRWARLDTLPTDGWLLAHYLPSRRQVLWLWQGGPGRDRILLTPFGAPAGEPPRLFEAPATVRLNEVDEGLWLDWGRVDPEAAPDRLHPGFEGTGEPAIALRAENGDVVIRRADLQLIEMPPRTALLRPAAAAWVPTLGGLLVPSVAGVGLDARRERFFPPEADPAGATPPLIDVIRRERRFWVFDGDAVAWLDPPSDLHPLIELAADDVLPDGRQRSFLWAQPESGLLRFGFAQTDAAGRQWVRSPLLSLRGLVPPDADPTSASANLIELGDAAVWGDPPEVVVYGWIGERGRRLHDRGEDPIYSEVPQQGFLARTPAFDPREWTVAALPLPYSEGTRAVAGHSPPTLFVAGGRAAVRRAAGARELFAMLPQPFVWMWDGAQWSRAEPLASPWSQAFDAAWDGGTRQLLLLTADALEAFDGRRWTALWRRADAPDIVPAEPLALQSHPLSATVLGLWRQGGGLRAALWRQQRWAPVAGPSDLGVACDPAPAGGFVGPRRPLRRDDVRPGAEPDVWVVIDHDRLAAIALDLERARDEDRFVGAQLWRVRRESVPDHVAGGNDAK